MAKKVAGKKEQELAQLVWEGDCREVARGFPDDIRKKLGEDIRRIQQGERPKDSKPMRSVGAKCFELRQKDDAGWYRTIFFGVIDGKLYALHSFIKKSAKTPKNDLHVAGNRLKEVKARIREEKKEQ